MQLAHHQPGATFEPKQQQRQQGQWRCSNSTWPIAVALQPMTVAFLPSPPPSLQQQQQPSRHHRHVGCRCAADGASTPTAPAPAAAPAASAPGRDVAAADAAAVTAAWALLKTFSTQEFRGLGRSFVGTPEARSKLRDALMLAYGHPAVEEGWNPYAAPREVLLGVVASDARLAVRALRDWCDALQLEFVLPDCSRVAGAVSVAAVTGTVYIKYNSVSKVCYLTQYQGADRGVLVQLGQGPLLGHFPLGFWDEGMAKPPPALAAS